MQSLSAHEADHLGEDTADARDDATRGDDRSLGRGAGAACCRAHAGDLTRRRAMDKFPADLASRPIIIGGGLAGLMTALHLAPEKVILLAKTPLAEGAASAWAQGGIAAALGPDDAPSLHAADTLAAGDGLGDPAVAARITAAAPAAIAGLGRRCIG